MAVEFRAIGPDEYPDLVRTMGLAFGFDPSEDDHFRHLLPLERTVVGFDGGRMVSTAGAFSLDMTIPGGTVKCGGTTIVSVAPTHRRQGLLRGMMRSHLNEVREQAEPIAALWASDSAIYGRFGFGQAAVHYDVSVRRDHVEFHRSAPQPAPVRSIDSAEAEKLLAPFYDNIRTSTPGFYARSPVWWEHRALADPEQRRNGATSYRFGVVDGSDGIAGYVQYRIKSNWDDSHGAGKVMVKDLFGSTPESWAGLWSYVLNHDLIAEITADHRSVQDPLFDLLAGTRRAKAQRFDNLWVRLMDVPRALKARSYSAPIDVVLEVHDPMGDIDGRYHLMASAEGAECQRTDAEPSISLDAEDLGGIYMGRSRLRALSRVGRVGGDPVSLAAADAAFTWDPQPWCPEVF
ncbi:MAG: GNAT family N-acetyltransferase [Acidimicrobiia bacterium]